jgi:hypothetical protein
MESTSFKKEYEKESLPDGSIKLTYKEKRIGAHQASLMRMFMAVYLFIFFWIWLVVTGALYWFLGKDSFGTSAITGFVIVMIGLFYFGNKLTVKKSSILIKPDGIIFDKQGKAIFSSGTHQLAFRDASDWGVGTETISGATYQETSYIYAHAGGQEIKITRHMKKPLANALLNEISAAQN